MPSSPLTLVCFAVKEEAASFKFGVAGRSDIQILLTGMGQRNAESSIRGALTEGAYNGSLWDVPRDLPALRSPSAQPSPRTPHPLPSPQPMGRGRRPEIILTCGFAGALNPELPFGTVLFSCDNAPHLQSRLLAAGARAARFHCANRVASTAAEKRALWESTHADAVEMESEIVSNICRQHQIPCATVRVILDTASEDLPLDFNFLMTADQQMDYRKLAFSLAKSPSKIVALLRLQTQSKAAAETLADVLQKIV